MNELDPYEASTVSGPNVAALVIGRSLTRFVYHLLQAVLIAADEFVPDGQLGSLANAQRVLESINIRLKCLSLDRPDEIGSLLRDCNDQLTDSWFSEDYCDAVNSLNIECHCQRDYDTERRIIVERFATSWWDRLDKAFRRAMRAEVVKWLELGQKLEQGLCRPDVFRFQMPLMNSWSVLRTDDYSTAFLESLKDLPLWPDGEANVPGQNPTQATLPRVAYVRRDPGDLIPHRFWWADVEVALMAAGLDVVHLDQLQKLRNARAVRKTIRALLIESIEKLFQAAHFAAGRGSERLRVDLKSSVVELDGTPYLEEKEVVVLLHTLKEDKGETSFAHLKSNYPDVYGKHVKLRDVLKKASQPIRELIGHGTGLKTTLQL